MSSACDADYYLWSVSTSIKQATVADQNIKLNVFYTARRRFEKKWVSLNCTSGSLTSFRRIIFKVHILSNIVWDWWLKGFDSQLLWWCDSLSVWRASIKTPQILQIHNEEASCNKYTNRIVKGRTCIFCVGRQNIKEKSNLLVAHSSAIDNKKQNKISCLLLSYIVVKRRYIQVKNKIRSPFTDNYLIEWSNKFDNNGAKYLHL